MSALLDGAETSARGLRDQAIVGLGELLWDLLPGGRQLGGAPANFAVMASRLGAHGIIASRIGEDELGRAALATLGSMPVDTRYLQQAPEQPTGSVSVELVGGQPYYTIHEPVAWDFLELTPAWSELAARADAVCFGGLAQRSARSRETIHAFLAETRPECVRVFDVNFRKPFVTEAAVRASLKRATILKLNDGEMPDLLAFAGLPQAPEGESEADQVRIDWLARSAQRLLEAWPMRLVAITLGAHGSLLVTREHVARHPGIPVTVADTVGAGDAFTAALTTYYLRVPGLNAASLAVLNEAGNRWGSWVASQAGAMPQLPDAVRERISAEIEAAQANA
jgi:fructokinase